MYFIFRPPNSGIKKMADSKSEINAAIDNPEKVLKLDKDLTVEEVEDFFKDSDDESENDTSDNFEILDEPTEAEKQMFEADMAKFKGDVQQERQRYQPSTSEKLFAMAKSLILRAIIFYFVLWLLRRGSSSRMPQNGAEDLNDSADMFDTDDYEDLTSNDINDEL